MVTMATVLIMQFVVLSQAWQIKRHGCHSNPLGHIAASILFFVPEGAAKRLWATEAVTMVTPWGMSGTGCPDEDQRPPWWRLLLLLRSPCPLRS